MKIFLKTYAMELSLAIMILVVGGIMWYRHTTLMASIVAPPAENWQATNIDDKKMEINKVRNRFAVMNGVNSGKTTIVLGDVSGKLRPYEGEVFRMVWSRNELLLCSLEAGADFIGVYLSAGLCLEINKGLTKDYADLVKNTKSGKSLKDFADEAQREREKARFP